MSLIQLNRLLRHIEQLGTIGQMPDGGVSRLSFTDAEQEANQFVEMLMQQAGMETSIDPIGNIIGTYCKDPSTSHEAPIIMGSHIDTVPNGGKYDGALGVLTAIEVIHTLHEHDITLARPIQVIAFKDEEGVRFGVGMLGSRAVAGTLTTDMLKAVDAQGITVAQAMENQHLQPANIHLAKIDPIYAYLELHIEQGRVLETENIPVGVVTGIAGPLRLEVTIHGLAEHAGATPMQLRQDALAGAAEMMVEIERIANGIDGTVATIGKIVIENAGVNVIPGQVTFTCDLRHVIQESRDLAECEIKKAICTIATKRHLYSSVKELQRVKPVTTDAAIMQTIHHAIEKCGYDAFYLSSGAGHDAMQFAHHCPIGMIFVRSKDGVSHNPLEYSSPEDIEAGAQVLFETILAL